MARGLLLLAAVIGCGPTSGGGPTVSWTADGVAQSATIDHLNWFSDGIQDEVDFNGSGLNVFLSMSLRGPAPLSAGTFHCGQVVDNRTAALSYVPAGGGALLAKTCAVVLTQVGNTPDKPILGTFEATFDKPGGGTISLANGRIDVALTSR
jgi:hypothetical protein